MILKILKHDFANLILLSLKLLYIHLKWAMILNLF